MCRRRLVFIRPPGLFPPAPTACWKRYVRLYRFGLAAFRLGERFRSRQLRPFIRRPVLHNPVCHDLHCRLDNCIAYGLEFRVPGQREPRRHVHGIGLKHFFPFLIPQGIEGSDPLILRQLIHDVVDEILHIGLEVSVHLLSAGSGQPPGQLRQFIFQHRIVIASSMDPGSDLLCQLFTLRSQRIPVLGLLLINAEQVLCKDIPCERGPQIFHPLLCEIAFVLQKRIGNKMHMGMMALIMEGGIPSQILHGDLQVLRERLGLGPQHVPPPCAPVKSQPLRILTAQGHDGRPYIPLMPVQLLGHLRQLNLDAVIGKKAVGTEALRPRAGGDVVGIGFAGHHRMGVILNGTGDKLRCGANGFLGTVIFILQHLPAVWEIPEELCDQDLLLCRGRQQLFRIIDLLHTLPGRNVFQVAARTVSGLDVFELGNELCHRPSPHSIPIERPSVSSSGPVSISSSNESASCCNFFSSAGSRT